MGEVVGDEDRGPVIVGGREMAGHIDDRVCPRRGEFRIYRERFDANFCARSNAWLEPGCDYCRERPRPPIQ